MEAAMSYTLTIGCGCVVYVASHPRTRIVHTRIIEQRGASCPVRSHDIGVRLQLWELLPDPEPREPRTQDLRPLDLTVTAP
jgi:hypothetical protein